MYYLGEEDQENNCKRAAELCQQAIDAGYEKGYGLLGFCYYYGQGIQEDKSMAVHWYTKAAENGSTASQLRLGECYLHGEGTATDYEQAVFWLGYAAEQNNADAQKLLGMCYENGLGVACDPEKAAEYYAMAEANA